MHVVVLNCADIAVLASSEVKITNLTSKKHLLRLLKHKQSDPVDVMFVPKTFVDKQVMSWAARMLNARILTGFDQPDILPMILKKEISQYAPAHYRSKVTAADMVVNTAAITDGIKAIMHGLARGQVVVTVPVPGLEPLLVHNQNCMVVNQANDMAPVTEYLLQHPEEVYRLAKNGQLWLKTHLESDLYPQLFAAGLKKLLHCTECHSERSQV